MKIALVAQHATPLSGDDAGQVSETRVRELSRSLASKGHRVTVYAQRHSAALPERAELEPGVTVEYIAQADSRPAELPASTARRGESELLAQVPAFSRPLHE